MKKSAKAFGEKPRKSVTFCWDPVDKALCFRTSEGFWKVVVKETDGYYRLWHLNHSHFERDQPDKVLMRRAFHRQNDVDITKQLGKIISYISEHDRAKKIIEQDWKQLPKKTPKQRRYYRQAKKKARRKENKRLDEIFRKIEKGEL